VEIKNHEKLLKFHSSVERPENRFIFMPELLSGIYFFGEGAEHIKSMKKHTTTSRASRAEREREIRTIKIS